MNRIRSDANLLNTTLSLVPDAVSGATDNLPCYYEFADAYRRHFPDDTISGDRLHEVMAGHLGVMTTMCLFRSYPSPWRWAVTIIRTKTYAKRSGTVPTSEKRALCHLGDRTPSLPGTRMQWRRRRSSPGTGGLGALLSWGR